MLLLGKKIRIRKKKVAIKIAAINTALEPNIQAKWELSTTDNQLCINNNILS